MGEQRIPGVRDAKRPSISAQTYALWTAITVVTFVAATVAVVHLPRSDTVDSVNFDLATPAGTSCTYDAGNQQTTIHTHLDATTRHSSKVVLTAGVRNTSTEAVAAKTHKTVDVRGHHQADYTFVVDVSTSAYAHGATACFVEGAANF